MRVNYTTYDGRRNQDIINTRTHADVMVLCPGERDVPEDEQHPYWYARVYGIFHAHVQYTGPGSQRAKTKKMEFLWVRWFERDMTAPGGFRARRLDRVGFVDAQDPHAFGFLDPDAVIRGAHLIPAFHYGKHDEEDLLPQSSLQRERTGEDQCDWRYYYVNM